MVQGLDKLARQLAAVPAVVQEEVRASLATSADALVAQMMAARPEKGKAIMISWSWLGENGVGVKTYTSRKTGAKGEYGMIAVKIRATGPRLNARIPFDLAQAFEFGTKQRFQITTDRETGAMGSRPFFFPVYRANKRNIRARARAAVARAVKRLNGT
jgi:hypothetical protein